MTAQYVPLHVHTDASADGAGTVTSLLRRAQEVNCPAIAMTDHGTLANAVAFWSACKDVGIKPIFGMEAYFLYEGARHHLTLLAENETGFNNLITMDNVAHSHAYAGGYPLVTLESLEEHQEGIIVLTGCASSAIHKGTHDDAAKFVGSLIDAIGKVNVFAEVMFVGTHDVWNRPLEMRKHFGIDHVVTNDTHYPCERQFGAHQAITKARRGFTYDSKQLWLKSYDEIVFEGQKFTNINVVRQGLFNTLHLNDCVEAFDLYSPPKLPHIEGCEAALVSALKEALKEDIERKGKKKTRIERLQYEFSFLKTKGFLDYIYILWDIVRWAGNQNIYVGPGRGSGGGSYILYLLGITQVDPIQYGLLFERFINPSRGDYPDVDTDFESERRQDVINYAANRWGTVPIATYSCYSHKSAIHDIARSLTIPKSLEEAAADSTDSDTLENFLSKHPDARETYLTMIGQIRHRGTHAAGVVVVNRPVPIERSGAKGELAVAWAEGMNTKDLSKVGLVKYDILGVTALSQLHLMADLTGEKPEPEVFDDPNVFDIFCDGDVAGIFQWTGSPGIRDLTMRIEPRNFKDLATINALYRPGALDAGTAMEYPKYMEEPRLIDPRIDPLLEETYGVIVFQEQFMSIFAKVTGRTFGEADEARRLLSKSAIGDPKWEAQMEDLRENFFGKGRANGYERDLLAELWGEIFTHSRYSFNKSHSTAYTMIAYQMAWYKHYHRPEFTLAMLQFDKANAQTYVLDAIEHGLTINLPDINYSTKEYVLVEDEIFLPLTDVAFLGEEGVDAILEGRRTIDEFTSYESFNEVVPKKKCNARARAYLERIGAFKSLSGDPKVAMPKYEEIPVKSLYQNQLEVLGYVVPSQQLIKKIEKLRRQPAPKHKERFAGFIVKVKKKKSSKGPYTVYTLSPHGSFWMRGETSKFAVGEFVSGTKSEFGNSLDVKRYRLGDE